MHRTILTINILKMIKKTLFSSFVLMAMTAAAQKTTITIDVNKPLHAVSPTLFGIFLEDINLSVDGGLYPVGAQSLF